MKHSSRLMLSAVFAITAHVGLLLNAGQSASNADANPVSSVMQFNLIAVAQAEPTTPEAIAQEPVPTVKPLKSTPTPTPTPTPVIEKKIQQSQKDSIPPKQAVKPPPLTQTQTNQIKVNSVVREQNIVIVQAPRFKSLPPAPAYPRQARLRGQQGIALIHAQLNAQGDVIKIRLAKSSGFSLLDKAALKAIHGWDFMPGNDSQGNTTVWVEVPIEFILNPKKVS